MHKEEMQDLVEFTKQKTDNLDNKIQNTRQEVDRLKGGKREEENKQR